MDSRHYNPVLYTEGILTLKWSKFLIYCYLFLAPIGGAVMSFLHFTGNIRESMLQLVATAVFLTVFIILNVIYFGKRKGMFVNS